ncbi:MAG: LysR family transcriptional regulator [Lawsonibacter sp.]|nr:LysR family transcriptional regulator [Lawsonibacter sp.]
MTQLEIEAFLSVVQTGNITKAAEHLYISQPALSRRLKALEQELGYTLFERKKGSRMMELTLEGAAFLPLAEQWRDLLMESRAVIEKSKRPLLRVGAVDSVNAYIMFRVYRRLMDEVQGIRFKIIDNSSFDAYRLMEIRSLDLSLVAYPMYVKGISAVPLFSEEMQLIGDKKLFPSKRIHPSQLDVRQELYVDWNREFVQWHEFWFGNDVQPKVFTSKMAFLEKMLLEGGGWAIVPASVAVYMSQQFGINTCQLLDPPANRVIYLLRHLDYWSNPLMDQMLGYLKELLQQIDGVTLLRTEEKI